MSISNYYILSVFMTHSNVFSVIPGFQTVHKIHICCGVRTIFHISSVTPWQFIIQRHKFWTVRGSLASVSIGADSRYTGHYCMPCRLWFAYIVRHASSIASLLCMSPPLKFHKGHEAVCGRFLTCLEMSKKKVVHYYIDDFNVQGQRYVPLILGILEIIITRRRGGGGEKSKVQEFLFWWSCAVLWPHMNMMNARQANVHAGSLFA